MAIAGPGAGPVEIHGKFWCEIWTGSRWEVWPVETALLFPEAAHRCYQCHGHVTLMAASETGWAHFEHKPAHRGVLPRPQPGRCRHGPASSKRAGRPAP